MIYFTIIHILLLHSGITQSLKCYQCEGDKCEDAPIRECNITDSCKISVEGKPVVQDCEDERICKQNEDMRYQWCCRVDLCNTLALRDHHGERPVTGDVGGVNSTTIISANIYILFIFNILLCGINS